MSANEVVGEFVLVLDGADHVMRPDWEAILNFETATGKGVITLAHECTTGALTTREMGMIAGACIRAYGVAEDVKSHAGVNDRAVTRCIAELGALNALKPIQRMLLLATSGGLTSAGEVKAVAVKKTPESEGLPATAD